MARRMFPEIHSMERPGHVMLPQIIFFFPLQGAYIVLMLNTIKTPKPGVSLFECYRQKIGLIFSKHNSVLVFVMGQNLKCP